MRPTSRQTTMVGPTQGGDGFGLGRGGGRYRRRLERDFGMRSVPFPGRHPARRGRAATTNDRPPTEGSPAEVEATLPPPVPLRSPLALAGRLAATVALLASLALAACAGGGAETPAAPPPPPPAPGAQPPV